MTDATITIRREGRLHGPYSAEQIRVMLHGGSVAYDDEAWSETAGKWTTLLEALALSPGSLNDKEHEIRLTAADVLGHQPATGPAAGGVYAQRRDRIANILAMVGLIAIALGTLDIALHMMRSAKSPASQAASPASGPSDTSNFADEFEQAEKGESPQ